MRIPACELPDVQSNACISDEAKPELLDKLGVECTDLLSGYIESESEIVPAGNISLCRTAMFLS
jgi:hypothetical protein